MNTIEATIQGEPLARLSKTIADSDAARYAFTFGLFMAILGTILFRHDQGSVVLHMVSIELTVAGAFLCLVYFLSEVHQCSVLIRVLRAMSDERQLRRVQEEVEKRAKPHHADPF